MDDECNDPNFQPETVLLDNDEDNEEQHATTSETQNICEEVNQHPTSGDYYKGNLLGSNDNDEDDNDDDEDDDEENYDDCESGEVATDNVNGRNCGELADKCTNQPNPLRKTTNSHERENDDCFV
ncbi:PREDICTED: uncharacterized protein LOC108974859 [Bactrocera latifrons]|uniref:uncharacterized protein LOC108974859 n=1 Tax=Bactrocera latifrons TaxID=174628 RepID=UPI0008DDF9D6|nr:PREDICTED: uncharacterized protein LOC108974859 [Bactrocera latifrons]